MPHPRGFTPLRRTRLWRRHSAPLQVHLALLHSSTQWRRSEDASRQGPSLVSSPSTHSHDHHSFTRDKQTCMTGLAAAYSVAETPSCGSPSVTSRLYVPNIPLRGLSGLILVVVLVRSSLPFSSCQRSSLIRSQHRAHGQALSRISIRCHLPHRSV